MKKNRMMRAASALLVAVLLTTCTISGTFAKYVTTGSGSDTARVAKWGVTITAQGDAFSKDYDDENGDSGFTKTVISTTDKVVAPGTAGTLTDLEVAGTPEVAVAVTYDATLTLTGWQLADSSEYCPIVFTVETEEFYIGQTGIDTIADLIAAVEGKIEGCKNDYPANVAIDTSSDAPSISWRWPFESVDNSKDTYLGNQASIDNAPIITLAITTTATQID